ncbi:MAG: hypothetical protein JO228_01355 [Xanthobacteraceae bacterium]|nr:hypothetical protein [Xanthobacteraceae bacterium]
MPYWNWMDAVRFGFEVQSVIAARLVKIATGAPDAAAECVTMVREKFVVATDAQTAGVIALAQGKSIRAATKRAMAPVKRRVRANYRRLKPK